MSNLFESDVEYFSEVEDIQAELKSAIWDDGTFREFLLDHGLRDTLYEVTFFHRSVADNLKANQIADLKLAPDWAKRAVRLSSQLKSRRTQLRRLVRSEYGDEAVEEINQEVLEDSE